MADTIRDVVVRIQLKQVETALKVPDLTPAKKSVADYGKTVKDSAKENEKAAREAEKAAKVTEAAESKKQAAMLKSLDTVAQLGEGVFTLARGIAFMAASSDENFRAMLVTLAQLQGGFDIVKGGVTTIKALVEGTNALKVATGAATAAQAVQMTVTNGLTASSIALSAAMKAVWASMGPVGWIILGITAAASALAAVWYFWDDADEPVKDTAEATKELTEEQKKQIATVKALSDAYFKFEQTQRDNQRASRERLASLKSESDQLADLFVAKQKLSEEQKKNPTRDADGNLTTGKNLTAELLDLKKDEFAVDLKIREVMESTAQAAVRELDAKKQSIQASKDALKLEQDKLQTIEASIGQLSKREQAELKRFSEQAKAGKQFSKQELDRIDQIGGPATSEFVNKQRAAQGRAAGASDIAAGFGYDAGSVGRAQKGLADAERDGTIEQIDALQKDLIEKTKVNQRKQLDYLEQQSRIIDELEARLNKLTRDQGARDAQQ